VQLGMCVFDNKKYHIAEHLIGSIDDDGYLRRPLSDIVDDLSFGQNIVSDEASLLEILKIIQTFDPVGVGARDLQECLLLQLKRKPQTNPFVKLATDIIRDYMEEFSRKHYDKIKKQLGIREEDLKEAMNEILHLNPRPGNSYADNQKSLQHVIPDFIITNNEDVLELTLNSKNAPDLRVSKSYINMLNTYAKDKKNKNSPSNKEAIQFVKHKIDSAKFFIDAINQRNQTLYLTMSTILNYQYEYFLEGDETKLKPMILKDISDRVGLDISTISRVASSKYTQTPFGTISLKSLFSEGMQTASGEEVSSREVKKILSDCILAESKTKPLTDDEVAAILKEKGYSIARRTVSKYREQLEIPVARMRKEL
jgi:RNA polymerase sigma-54 factor